MTKQHINTKDIFCSAWSKTKQHAWFLVCTFLIAAILCSAVALNPLLETVVGLLVALSLVSIALMIVRNHGFSFEDLYKPILVPKMVCHFLILSLIAIVVIGICAIPVIGLIVTLYKVPSIVSNVYFALTPLLLIAVFVSVRFKFFPFVVLDNPNASIKELITRSYRLTRGYFWQTLGFLLLIALFNVLGIMTIIGFILTVPISLFAAAYYYEKLREHTI